MRHLGSQSSQVPFFFFFFWSYFGTSRKFGSSLLLCLKPIWQQVLSVMNGFTLGTESEVEGEDSFCLSYS